MALVSHGGYLFDGTSLGADATSGVILLGGKRLSVSVVTTGAHWGSIALQASNDGTNWVPAICRVTSIGRTATIYLYSDMNQNLSVTVDEGQKFFRMAFTRITGTGTITAIAY